MKKKRLSLILAVAVSASMLAGCGNSAETVNRGDVAIAETETAEVADNTETETAEAADNTEIECEHEWAEATYKEAKHCSKCGETEGEPKQSYFDEHGAEVADAPVACTVNVLNYNDDNPEEYYMITDGTWEQIDCYREPAEEEGYQLIHFELSELSQNHYYAAQDIYYNCSFDRSLIYDWYTGRMFPVRSMTNTDAFELSITLDIDGISYDVSYTKELQGEFGDFVYADNGDATKPVISHYTYTFKVPDGYDGLVFAIIPVNEYTEQDTETVYGIDIEDGEDDSESNKEDAYYAFDENEYVDGTKFFRINKEGMVPERLSEDSIATAD